MKGDGDRNKTRKRNTREETTRKLISKENEDSHEKRRR